MRLDKKLLELFPEKTRSQCANLIQNGLVKVNNVLVHKTGFAVEDSDEILLEEIQVVLKDIVAEDIPLNIVFENDDFLVINKSKDIAVHPGDNDETKTGTIVNAVLYHCGKDLSNIDDVIRPGIVHRLDKDTTGVLIVAKNNAFHACLAKQIEERSVKKMYRAIVMGRPQDGVIEAPISRSLKDRKKMAVRKGGRTAKTIFKVLEYFEDIDASLVEIQLITGRTHQIRVHFTSIGYPVIGDVAYGNDKRNAFFKGKFKIDSQVLHAYSYEFLDLEGKEQKFVAEEPKEFAQIINREI